MQTPNPKMGTDQLRGLGLWHLAALDLFEETRPLLEGFQPYQDAIITTFNRVNAADDALIPVRLKVKLTEMVLEEATRRCFTTCETVDGKKQGPMSTALFPKGLTAVIQPVGAGQVVAIQALLARGKERNLNTHEQIGPQLQAVQVGCERLDQAVKDRERAYSALAGAHTGELLAREEFCTAYSRQAGLIRSTFPNDRRKQDFFFDTFRKVAEAAEPGDDGPTPPLAPTA